MLPYFCVGHVKIVAALVRMKLYVALLGDIMKMLCFPDVEAGAKHQPHLY